MSIPSYSLGKNKRLLSTKLHATATRLGKQQSGFSFTAKRLLHVSGKIKHCLPIKSSIRFHGLGKTKRVVNAKLVARGYVLRKTKAIDIFRQVAQLSVTKVLSSGGGSAATQTPIKRFLLDGVEDMAIDIPHYIKTINKRIVAEPNGNTGVLIYTPGKWTKAASAGSTVDIKFWGLIWTLQLTCQMNSLMETDIDPPDPAASQAELALLAKQLGENPNIILRMYLSNPNDLQNDSDLLWISIYNSRPVYQVDLIPYLTRSNLFGIEYGKQLKIDVINNGYGVLQNDDSISVTGCIYEESNYFIGVAGTVEPIISQ